MSSFTEKTELRVCEVCGYGRGFHVFFQKEGASVKVGFICPSCGASYDISYLIKEMEKLMVRRREEIYDSKE